MKNLLLGAALLTLVTGCDANNPSNHQNDAMNAAQEKASKGEYYIPKNGLERNNYNMRQEIADDPTTILWCTFFPFGDTGPITFPIVGKMTSGNKRPYPTTNTNPCNNSNDVCTSELAGPDSMYGTSGDYRYGFGPDGVYNDVYDLPTFCTTKPMVYRRQPSGMNIAIVDTRLSAASENARQALRQGQHGGTISPEAQAKADQILSDAITSH